VAVIARMSKENPAWSRHRIAAELAMLGWNVSKGTVARYITKPPLVTGRPPSTNWAAFVRLDLAGTIAIDFLTVPTATFRTLYVFVVLSLERRVVLHLNVTSHPHAAWAAQQIVEALGPEAPTVKRLIRDRDGIYGAAFNARVQNAANIVRRPVWRMLSGRWSSTLRRLWPWHRWMTARLP
jgi:putative transposase